MKENKDEALTYEELTALCRKQEEHIKELENKINSNVLIPKGTEKCEVAKPDYNELVNRNNALLDANRENRDTIQALLYALKSINNERLVNDDSLNYFQDMFLRERSRADKLFDELEEMKK